MVDLHSRSTVSGLTEFLELVQKVLQNPMWGIDSGVEMGTRLGSIFACLTLSRLPIAIWQWERESDCSANERLAFGAKASEVEWLIEMYEQQPTHSLTPVSDTCPHQWKVKLTK